MFGDVSWLLAAHGITTDRLIRSRAQIKGLAFEALKILLGARAFTQQISMGRIKDCIVFYDAYAPDSPCLGWQCTCGFCP